MLLTIRPLLLMLLIAAPSPLIAADPVQVFNYRVMEQRPHGRDDFTQGLELRDGLLYQGTGRYGYSSVQVFDFESGELLQQRALPQRFFGEGITVLNDEIVQLTWRSGQAFVYQRSDLSPLRSFPINGEGWGLTHDGHSLIMSDGSDTLRWLDPETGHELRTVQVTANGRPVRRLNELEWTPSGILANLWRSDWIVRIDPTTGRVTQRINLSGLLTRKERRQADVLNGIAVDHATDDLWVTGKNWPWIYRIELLPRSTLE